MKNLRLRLSVPAVILLVVGVTYGLAVTLKESKASDVTSKIGLNQRLGNQLPLNTPLTDEHGHPVKLGDYFGKRPVLLMLVFFSCQGACETQLQNSAESFAAVKDASIGKDYDVVSLSIFPKETSELALDKKAEAIDKYGRAGASDGWHFLTGQESSIKRIADAIGYRYYYDSKSGRLLHPTGLFAVTKDGRLSRYLYGIDYAPSLISESIRTASKGEIGARSEPILFGCFSYDPKTGKIMPNMMRVTQIAGLATVLLLAFSIFRMIRNDHNVKLTAKEGTLDGGM